MPAFMTRILTVECYGDLPTGRVPCISWPLPELGDGKAEDAPMLVPSGPQQWELRVAVRGAAADSCLTACVPGMCPLQFPDFNLGRGYQPLPPSVRWTYKLGPVLRSAATHIYYYSGWPSVRLRVIDGQDSRDFALEAVGLAEPGKRRCGMSASLQRTLRSVGVFCSSDHTMGLIDLQMGRLPSASLRVYLMDGEIFPSPPPLIRSAPRVETMTVPAAALEHTFVVHIVLPRDYDVVPERVFPVVFLNDGQNQFTDRGMWGGWHTDSTAAQLMRAGRMQDTVLVAVEMHPNRNRAYLPRGDARALEGQALDYPTSR